MGAVFVPLQGRWFLATVGTNLAVFAVVAWATVASEVTALALLPVVTLVLSWVAGLVLLMLKSWREVGARVLAAGALLLVAEPVFSIMLLFWYAAAHPNWDLS